LYDEIFFPERLTSGEICDTIGAEQTFVFVLPFFSQCAKVHGVIAKGEATHPKMSRQWTMA